MNEHQRYEHGFGPVYSVPLIDKLPLNREKPGGMLQQMPSAADLEGIRPYRQGARVCAGYEVLLNHWRLQQAEIERLQSIINAKLHQRRCHDCGRVGWYADSRTPYCLCDRCCSWLCDQCRSWDTRRVKEAK